MEASEIHPAISLSIGVVTLISGEDLVRQADISLYQAKRARAHAAVETA